MGLDTEQIPCASYDHRRQRRQARRCREANGDLTQRSRADDRGVAQEQNQTPLRPHAKLWSAYPYHAENYLLRRVGKTLRDACLGLYRMDASPAHGRRTGRQSRRRDSLPPGTAPDRHPSLTWRRLGEERARLNWAMV